MSKEFFYFNECNILITKSGLDDSIVMPLIHSGIVTIGGLIRCSADEIRNINSIDEEKITSIRQYLEKFPLCLIGEEESRWKDYDKGITFEELGLCTTTVNKLGMAGITNLFELSLLTKDEVSRVHSIGRISILEIESALNKAGMKFRTDSCMKRH